MSGLYNMLFGVHPLAGAYLTLLQIPMESLGRFRDCYVSEVTDEGATIVVYTRNGGPNRPSNQWVFDLMKTHPWYSKDYDDDVDNTYASIEFHIPLKVVHKLPKEMWVPMKSPCEKFDSLMGDLQSGTKNSQTSRALEAGKFIFDSIEDTMKK